MTLAYACIAPHGGGVIPRLASKRSAAKFSETTRGMRVLAKGIRDSTPDTIVIATPHNLRLFGRIAVVTAENSSGNLKGSSGRTVSVRAECDSGFAKQVLKEAEKLKLPVVGANYGTASGEASNMPMDWGTLVPLWFVLKRKTGAPTIVIVAPSREIPLNKNYRFGKMLGRLMQSGSSKRFVFIASADQAHAHRKSGPYGFNPAAAEYDRLIMEVISSNRLESILNLDPAFVEKAKPDSLWQMTILAGITSIVPCRSELISYQVPTYYGMACASFQPIQNR